MELSGPNTILHLDLSRILDDPGRVCAVLDGELVVIRFFGEFCRMAYLGYNADTCQMIQ